MLALVFQELGHRGGHAELFGVGRVDAGDEVVARVARRLRGPGGGGRRRRRFRRPNAPSPCPLPEGEGLMQAVRDERFGQQAQLAGQA